MKLAGYDECKFTMAQLLRTMQAVAPRSQREIHDQIRACQTRLAEDRFNLAVVGRFSRGKSSLMNAMLRTERRPTGVEPLTSVVTSVSYGTKEQVLIHHEGWSFPEETTIESLPQFVTQHGNPGNEKKVRMAEIQMPADLLREGFYFVDTPGLGSPILENTATTQQFLPEIDALILVSGFDDPLDTQETQALEAATRVGRKIFVVLNKEDLVSDTERTRVCSEISARLRSELPTNTPDLFALSALEAIHANASADSVRLEHSKVPAFQQAIVDFLMERKSALILEQMAQRLTEIRHASKEIGEAQEIISGFEAMQALVENFLNQEDTDGDASLGWMEGRPKVRGTCRVCVDMHRKGTEFLRHFQYEITISTRAQEQHAEAGGLCPLHTWQYEAIASPQGVAESQPLLLDRLAEALLNLDISNPVTAADSLEKLLPTRASCAMCRVIYQAEEETVEAAAKALDEDHKKETTEMCLRHTSMVLRRLQNSQAASTLVRRTAQLLHRTAEDMARYAIKHEGLRRYLASEEEKKAYLRALLLLGGVRTVAMPVQVQSPM